MIAPVKLASFNELMPGNGDVVDRVDALGRKMVIGFAGPSRTPSYYDWARCDNKLVDAGVAMRAVRDEVAKLRERMEKLEKWLRASGDEL